MIQHLNTSLLLAANEIPIVVETKDGHATDYLLIRNVLVFFICVIAIIFILTKFGVFTTNQSAKKLKEEQQSYNKIQKQRKQTQDILSALDGFADKVGGGISTNAQYAWDFRILRLMQPIESVGRKMTSKELVGLLRLIQFLCVSIGCAAFCITFNVFFVIFIVIGVSLPTVVASICDMQIAEQDKAIERDFTDFYLLVHSRLLKGTQAHISNTLTEYLNICDTTMPVNEYKELREFVSYLRSSISIMGDEVKALNQVREKYHSATVTNFCTLATQALQGVDNQDRLLTFKVELIARQKAQVRAVAQKRAEKAMKAIFAIWVILAEFVVVVMVTRLSVVF